MLATGKLKIIEKFLLVCTGAKHFTPSLVLTAEALSVHLSVCLFVTLPAWLS
jgi:hypothetical protein